MLKISFIKYIAVLMIGCVSIFLSGCSQFSKQAATDPTEGYSTERKAMEQEAQKRLDLARKQLAQNQLQEAKATIKKMRKDCYLALTARKKGILLMDSVDLKIAQNELMKQDSIMLKNPDKGKESFKNACQKVQFLERKLQYDKRTENKN